MEYALLILSGIGIILFLWLFTGELNASNGRLKLLWMARFSYLFVLTVMALILASFTDPRMFAPEPSRVTDNPAFSVVPACLQPSQQASVPAGLDCSKSAYQWVINIGGIELVKNPAKGAATESANPTTPTPAPDYVPPDDVVHLQGGLVVPLFLVIVALMGGAVSMTRRVPEIQKQAWRYIELGGTDPADATSGAHGVTRGDLADSRYLEADGDDISTRRPITLDFARERLIFQVMQVVSAPIIAMIAYYLFEPDSKAMSIAIAFVSGFASETVLIGIRRIGDSVLGKVSGGTPAPAPAPRAPAPTAPVAPSTTPSGSGTTIA